MAALLIGHWRHLLGIAAILWTLVCAIECRELIEFVIYYNNVVLCRCLSTDVVG